MLLEYQIRNLKHLELALQTTDTITIIGQPKSGRKTVISSLNFEKSLFISIVPYTNQYQNCSDFLTAIKNIKVLYKILYLIFDYPHKHYTFKHFEI